MPVTAAVEPQAGPYPAAPVPVPPLSPEQRRWHRIKRVTAALLLLLVLLVGWLALTAPLSKSLEPIVPPQITLLASDGTPIARNGAIVDAPVAVAKLPDHVVQAFLAIEDRRFYTHWGVDGRGTARALWSNISGGPTQGGSTITQQLAKFTFLTPERSLTRKAREAVIAVWLESWLTKDEILERYLSNAYFGDNCYGLRAASLHYFYRKPENLTLAQAAMLAGLVQAPSRLAPTKNYDLAKKRMQLVLSAMAAVGHLTEAEAKAVRAPAIDVRARGGDVPTGTYFADWALPQARKQSEIGYTQQTITTTLDARMQAAARRAVVGAGLGQAQVALVAMRPNGEVVAMIGGRNYAKSPFNRATQAKRQPGSTFKLFVYLAALRAGIGPDDRIANTPIETGSYRPQNAGGDYSGSITLADAFARSSNVAAVRLWQQVGDDKVIAMARDLGVTAPLTRGDPSLALGTSSMTLLELTAAYAAVAGDRYPVVPHAFVQEEQGWIDWLFNGPSRFSRGERDGIRAMLRAAVDRGTGRAARLRQPVYGKTGTSQMGRDALFIGWSGDLVVGVWVGNDDNSPLAAMTGGGLPARIWRDFMVRAGAKAAAPAKQRANPRGPVEPLDGPVNGDIPLGDGTILRIENGAAVISTDIGGVPLDVRVDSGAIAERVAAQREAAEAARRAAERVADEAIAAAREAAREGAGPP